jgi:hypothetical protein
MVQTLAAPEQEHEVAPADPNKLRRATRKQPHLGKRITQNWSDYLYVAPAILVMAVVIGYPLVYTIYLSFFRDIPRTGDRVYDGVANYQLILNSDRFWDVTKNTFVWTIFSTGFAFVLGLGAALMIHKEFIGRGVVRGLLLIPWVISYVAAAYVWRWLFHSDFGLINGFDKVGHAFADHHKCLERISLRHDHGAGGIANRARAASAGGQDRWREQLEPVRSCNRATTEERHCDYLAPAVRD